MIHTLKKPKLLFNKTFKSKINIKILKNTTNISDLNNNILNLKKELININMEIQTIQNSLQNLQNTYSYSDFIQIKQKQDFLEKSFKKEFNIDSSTPIKNNNEPTIKALTIVKTRNSSKYCKYYKKSS